MNKMFSLKTLVALTSVALLAACGGGSGGSNNNVANQDPQGFWYGTSAGYNIEAVILENGELYNIFSKNGVAYGVDYGTITVSGSSYNGVLKEFYIPTNQVYSGAVNATFVPKTSMQGTTQGGTAAPVPFTARYDSSYDTPATLAQITGTYTGNYYTGAPVNLSISSNGVVSGISVACQIGGSVAPRASGKNVYNVNLVFSGANCQPGTGSASGIGVLSVVNGSTYLYTAGLNASQTNGFFWIGKKQ